MTEIILKEQKIEWNKVKYIDCMNEKEGLPSLPSKSVDLCLTDPPYGIKYKDKLHKKSHNYNDQKIITYNWLEEVLRVCKGLIFTPGTPYLFDYIKYKTPSYQIRGSYYFDSFKTTNYDPILLYGKINNVMSIRYAIKTPRHKYDGFIHPCPKSMYLWLYLLRKIKPKSVLDCFMGSGTTASACTKLGIKWLGYEINEVYSQDINKRLKNCKKEVKMQQVALW